MIIFSHTLFYLLLCTWLFLCTVVALPSLILPSSVLEHVVRFWAKGTMHLSKLFLGIDYTVLGTSNIPPKGPFIVACKHQSAWETISLLIILKNPAFVLKHSLVKIPAIGLFIKKLNMIPVYRGKKNNSFLEKARAESAKSRPIVIFPEGTRTTPGQRRRYFRGVFALYKDLHISVVPVALNSGIFWPRRNLLKKKGTISIDFMQAIPPG